MLRPRARRAATLRIVVAVGVFRKSGFSSLARGGCRESLAGASCISVSPRSELGNSIGGEDMILLDVVRDEGKAIERRVNGIEAWELLSELEKVSQGRSFRVRMSLSHKYCRDDIHLNRIILPKSKNRCSLQGQFIANSGYNF